MVPCSVRVAQCLLGHKLDHNSRVESKVVKLSCRVANGLAAVSVLLDQCWVTAVKIHTVPVEWCWDSCTYMLAQDAINPDSLA